MYRREYDRKMNDILSDSTTFKTFKLNEDIYKLALKKEDKVNRILKKLRDRNIITPQQYNNMFSSSTGPSIMYGSLKIHKPGTPLRPILAAYNTATYKLAIFLAQLL